MHSKRLHKIIGSIIIVSLFTNTFLFAFPQNTKAQFGIGVGGGGAGGISETAGPILGAGVSCGLNLLATKLIKKGVDKGTSALEGSVTVTDSETNYFTGKVDTKLNCLNKIAKAATQVLLKKITIATINWINSGFKGQPIFIKDPKSLALSIASDEIENFRVQLELSGPYGHAIAQNVINSARAYFGYNARYSLDRILGMAPAQQFSVDFAAGGWEGWYGSILYPQNNPFGASYEAADELSSRLSGIVESKIEQTSTELNRSGGFLDLKRCVETDYVEDSSNRIQAGGKLISAKKDLQNYMTQNNIDPNMTGPINDATYFALNQAVADAQVEYDRYICDKYETTTPGGYAAQALYNVMDSPLRQLEFGQDLDASLTAIFDSLLNQALNMGIDALATSDSGISTGVFGGYGNNGGTTQSNLSGQNGNGHWATSNATFDIDTDLSQLIRWQDDFLYELEGEYFSKTSGIARVLPDELANFTNLSKYEYDQIVNPTKDPNHVSALQSVRDTQTMIKQADFCLPGPRPDWLQKAQLNLFDEIGSYQPSQYEGNEEDHESELTKYYSTLLHNVTGVNASTDHNEQTSIRSFQRFQQMVMRIFQGGTVSVGDTPASSEKSYKNAISLRYNMFTLPSSTLEINKIYFKIPSYEESEKEITDQIASTRSIMRRLDSIRSRIKIAKQNALLDPRNKEYANLVSSFINISGELVDQSGIDVIKGEIENNISEKEYAMDLTYLCRQEVDGLDRNGNVIPNYTWNGPKERMPYPGIENNFPNLPNQKIGFKTVVDVDGYNIPTFLPRGFYGIDANDQDPGPTPGLSPQSPIYPDNYLIHVSDLLALTHGFSPTGLPKKFQGAITWTIVNGLGYGNNSTVTNQMMANLLNQGRSMWYLEAVLGIY